MPLSTRQAVATLQQITDELHERGADPDVMDGVIDRYIRWCGRWGDDPAGWPASHWMN
jgi:hypothetical protein